MTLIVHVYLGGSEAAEQEVDRQVREGGLEGDREGRHGQGGYDPFRSVSLLSIYPSIYLSLSIYP